MRIDIFSSRCTKVSHSISTWKVTKAWDLGMYSTVHYKSWITVQITEVNCSPFIILTSHYSPIIYVTFYRYKNHATIKTERNNFESFLLMVLVKYEVHLRWNISSWIVTSKREKPFNMMGALSVDYKSHNHTNIKRLLGVEHNNLRILSDWKAYMILNIQYGESSDFCRNMLYRSWRYTPFRDWVSIHVPENNFFSKLSLQRKKEIICKYIFNS